MKYRINTCPEYSPVPVIELKSSKNGKIKYTEVHPECSVPYSGSRVDDLSLYFLTHIPEDGVPKFFSECSDEDLGRISRACNYIMEELEEIRYWERLVRGMGITKD
jgi:hypothetical protein